MESFWSGKLTEKEKILRNKLISVLKESDLTCAESGQIVFELSEELRNASKRSSELFTMDEIWTRYENKLAEKSERIGMTE